VTEDTETNLKDDYVLAVNKDKILALEIPGGYATAGTTMDVQLKLSDDIKNMFLGDAPEEHDAKLAYDLFKLMMDWDSRNALGAAPLKEQVDAVEALDSLDALSAYFNEVPPLDQLSGLWSSGSTADFTDSTRYVLMVGECGLLLGDSAEYSAADRLRRDQKGSDLGACEEDAGQGRLYRG
jgi:Predicted metalloendopeptidase